MEKKKKLGLVPRLIIGIILGILIGSFLPEPIIRVVITMSTLFSTFLKFVIPLMILAFVTMGIADLTQGAGKLLATTAGISYASTLVAGTCAFFVAITLFPKFISADVIQSIGNPEEGMLDSFFSIPLTPIMDVTAAVALAFILGLCISSMRGKEIGDTCYNFFSEFSKIINKVLNVVIIPLLPLYIMGTFANMTVSGQTFAILSVLWKVFLVVICLHLIYLVILFTVSGTISKKNPIGMLKNQVPGYLAAIGTQSSAACIPVNIKCAESNGVCQEIRNFVIPLCANIHMAGSMITITCCVTSVLLMSNMEINLGIIVPFIMTLGIAMIASPGAPGGSIMSALPFLPMVGIGTESALASLLIALYITQDSFGTACNVSGDNAIAAIIDLIYKKFIKKEEKKESDVSEDAEAEPEGN
ncbi:dicarboxylate/amino acid:cation symporter [Velocimicrobium porci]|uniref:Dicarboxylate/amino acid:cation symporter n=1 Tax=Velocimicrobium porci TaxID=2606634 RepID=A0A6L5Y2D0_9FIRM|nr:dicarboxylate/amino acid:cation symporter [Velocimicrobium porci]MSS64528.1 dicarboxylate/amino acid:cation symporter [Velocimicrobium porci]